MHTEIQSPTSHIAIAPAQLWIGYHDDLIKRTSTYLQKILCKNQGCMHCTTCRQIEEKQHHALLWLRPEKYYTVDEIAPIFNTISFVLSPDDHFFFILERADFLTATCANSLLKSLEEPPAGYHFILLAERQEQILPTIRSRCITQTFYSETPQSISPLFEYFSTTTAHSPLDFLTTLEQSKINERESIELIDALLTHWIEQFKKAVSTHNQEARKKSEHMITILKKAVEYPPMPGSSKLFWKNVFLQRKVL